MARAVPAAHQHAKAHEHMPFQRQLAPKAAPQRKAAEKRPQQPGGQRKAKNKQRCQGKELAEHFNLARNVKSRLLAPVCVIPAGCRAIARSVFLRPIQLRIVQHRAGLCHAAIGLLQLVKIALCLPHRPICAHRPQQCGKQGDAHKRRGQPHGVKELQFCTQCPTPPSDISGFWYPARSFRANCAHAP